MLFLLPSKVKIAKAELKHNNEFPPSPPHVQTTEDISFWLNLHQNYAFNAAEAYSLNLAGQLN